MKNDIKFKKNEEAALKNLKETVSKRFNLVDFRIFGSKARGEDTPESDMDVMMEIDGSQQDMELEIYDIVFNINLENDLFISPTIFRKRDIEEGPMSESPIYKIIQKEGVPI